MGSIHIVEGNRNNNVFWWESKKGREVGDYRSNSDEETNIYGGDSMPARRMWIQVEDEMWSRRRREVEILL